MTAISVLPWAAFAVTALGLAATWVRFLFADRPAARRQELSAEQQQDIAERQHILETADFYSKQVPALQEANLVLRERLDTAEKRLLTIETASIEAGRVLFLQHAEELAARDKEIGRLIARLRKYEPDGERP